MTKFLKASKNATKFAALIERKKGDIKKGKRPPKPTDSRTKGKPESTEGDTNTDADITAMKAGLTKVAGRDQGKRENNVGSAQSKFGACFKKIMGLRYDTLCLRCSGKATDFYDSATASYKMKSSTCPAVVKECAPVYAVLAESQQFYMQLVKLRASLGKSNKASV